MLTRLVVLTLLVPFGLGRGTLRAQESAGATLTVTPSIGMAAITRNGNLESGGMSAFLEVDLHSASLLWSAYAGQRGIGVRCSDGCELGGSQSALEFHTSSAASERVAVEAYSVGPMSGTYNRMVSSRW